MRPRPWLLLCVSLYGVAASEHLFMLSNRRLSILLFRFSLLLLESILERRLAKQFSHDTQLHKLNQTHDGEACVCWSSLNDPRVR